VTGGPDGGAGAEPPSFEEFYAAEALRLTRLVRLILRDEHEAKDVVAKVLAKIWNRWSSVSRMENIHAYARTAVVRECDSVFRRWKRRRETALPVIGDGSAGPRDEYEDFAGRDEILRQLGALSLRQCTVLTLRYYEQWSDAEIAARLNISENTVRVHAKAALDRLRSALGPPAGEVSHDE
jgi:RNA polymerase sigma factor (sigma-70 family)